MKKQRSKEQNRILMEVLKPFRIGTLLLFPLFIWSMFQSQNYELVTRVNPSVSLLAMPQAVFKLSWIAGLAYFLLLSQLSRRYFAAYFANPPVRPKFARVYLYLSMLCFSLPFVGTIWGMSTFLNGALDSSPPRTLQIKAIKKITLGTTLYFVARDWNNPQGCVYFRAHDQFVKAHPFGSTFTITTKSGWLGYEWYQSGYTIYCK